MSTMTIDIEKISSCDQKHFALNCRHCGTGMRMIKRPKNRYKNVDWSCPTWEIAAHLGVTPTAVSAARKRLAPETVRRRGQPMRSSRWYGVDMNRPTSEISRELGVCPSAVSHAKRRYKSHHCLSAVRPLRTEEASQ